MREIVDQSKWAFGLPTETPEEARIHHQNIGNLQLCRRFVLEELRQPITEALERRLGKKEASKLVDFEETDWVLETQHWVIADKGGERRAFLHTHDRATLEALGAWFLMRDRLSELDRAAPSPDTWDDTYWKDYRVCCEQDISNFERKMKDFYTLSLEGLRADAAQFRRIKEAGLRGHEYTHGTQAEKENRWAEMQKECDELHVKRPKLSWVAIGKIVAANHKKQLGWSARSIKRHCNNPTKK